MCRRIADLLYYRHEADECIINAHAVVNLHTYGKHPVQPFGLSLFEINLATCIESWLMKC